MTLRMLRWSSLVGALTALTWLGTAQGRLAEPVGFSDSATLAADLAFLQKGLQKDPQKRELPTLKAVALLVALNSQNSKTDQSGVRDGALAVAAALSKKDFAQAKMLAAGLADAKPTDKKALDLKTVSKTDLEEIMSCFRRGTVGGLNLEADIKAYSRSVTDVKAAGVVAGRVALIADYTLWLPPSDAAGDKKAQWDKWSTEMGTIAKDIHSETAKGDQADKAKLAKSFKALETNCNACHTVFRQ